MQTFRLKPVAVKLGENSQVANKVQILRTGNFHHPDYGKFDITTETLQEFQRNFRQKVRGIDIAIDYSHESDKEAAGWIKDLFLNEDGTQLWAEVEWTPDGSKAIEGKKYRYLSADFSMSYVDAETKEKFGPTLHGAGLTNRPFVKDMAPTVELKEGDMDMTLEEAKSEIKKLTDAAKKLNEEYGMSPEEMKKKIAKLEEDLKCAIDDKKKLEEKYAADAKMAEKTKEFDSLMTEGKAVEAQRDAFMKDDMKEFIKLSQKLHTKAAGSGAGAGEGEGEKRSDSKTPAQDEVMEKAQKLLTEKKASTIRIAISEVLKADAKLAEKYAQETKGK